MPSDDDYPLPLHGGCRCGRLRYRVDAAPLFVMACHCTDCQRFTASAFSLGMAVPRAGVSFDGDPTMFEKTADGGGWSRQFTCPTCAVWTHTLTEHAPEAVIVRPITLDDHCWVRPVAELFTRSALPWARLDVPLRYEAEFDTTAPLEQAFRSSGIRPRPAPAADPSAAA